MHIIYAKESFPNRVTKSLFLAGPTPRDKSNPSWRPEALKALEAYGYDGHVFVPEPRGGDFRGSYDDQIEWEEEGLNRADIALFWIPRDMATMPALTTNDEWGVWKGSGKAVLGCPDEATRVRYQQHYAKKLGVPVEKRLQSTLLTAIDQMGNGAEREGGECCVPLYLWNTPSFQSWYQAQKKAGNRLDGGRVVWTGPAGKRKPFFWAFHANIHVQAEGRNKSNEIVLARPDVSQVVLFRPGSPHSFEDEIVLVKEFRSPGSTADGFIRELPGGSSPNPAADALRVAVGEVEEEVGITIDPTRFKAHGAAQLAATFSAHKSHLFSVILTEQEMAWVKSQKGVTRGLSDGTASSERTYVEVYTYRQLLSQPVTDWSTLGMISQVLL